MADERFTRAIDRHKLVALILGVAIYVVWIAGVRSGVLCAKWMEPVSESLITLALCDLVVRRTNVTRFLFGMRPLREEKRESV